MVMSCFDGGYGFADILVIFCNRQVCTFLQKMFIAQVTKEQLAIVVIAATAL